MSGPGPTAAALRGLALLLVGAALLLPVPGRADDVGPAGLTLVHGGDPGAGPRDVDGDARACDDEVALITLRR